MDSAIVGGGPNAVNGQRRRSNGVNHAALCWLGRLFSAILADAGRNFKRRTREVRRNLLPTLAAVHRLPQSISGEIKNVRVLRREDDWLSAQDAVIRPAESLGRNVLRLISAAVIARELTAIDDIGIERIRDAITVFFRRNGMPFTNRDLAVIPAARDARRAAFLLAAAQAIGESIVSIHVV